MLSKFTVQGFRNFIEETTIDFSSSGDNSKYLLYGKNASGKSNLGEAIFDIFYTLVGEYPEKLHSRAKFIYEFKDRDKIIRYSYARTDTILQESLAVNNQVLFDYNHHTRSFIVPPTESLSISEFVVDTFMQSHKPIAFLRFLVHNTGLPAISPVWNIYDFAENMQLVKGALPHADIYALTKNLSSVYLLNKWLAEFGITQTVTLRAGELFIRTVLGEFLPFEKAASSGTQSLIQLYLQLEALGQGSFVYLDEFDAFYHFSLAEKVVEKYTTEYTVQMLFATHNTNLLGSSFIPVEACFNISEKGISNFPQLTNRKLVPGLNIQRLFKAGEFDVF